MLKLSVFFFVSFCSFDCLFVLNVPTLAKVISRRGHSLKSDRLVKPEIKHTTPCLQGEEYSGSSVLMNLRPYHMNMTDPWSYFCFGFTVLVNCHDHVEMVS